MSEALPLIEPTPIDDDLCTGLALIEELGWGARFVFDSRQSCYESGDEVRVVRRKIVLPVSALGPLAEQLGALLARRRRSRGSLHLVR